MAMAQRGSHSLKSLERTTLREQCLVALRSAITSGQLSAGEHLVETELSEAFGVSRGTLREALRRLEQEGLVVAGARGRLSVRTVSLEEVTDIYRVRASLEALAARTLSEDTERQDKVAKLKKAAERLHQSEGDLQAQVEADLAFHRLLCELTDNQALISTWSNLEGPIRMTFMHAGTELALRNMSADRHMTIVDAIMTGDTRQAENVVIEHMDEAVRRLHDAFATLDKAASNAD